MAEPTLQQVFGSNATQDNTDIIIKKSDLPGLTASNNNTAESLVVAIILKSADFLTATNRESNSDQSVVIGEMSETITTSFVNNQTVRYNQKTIPIELYKPQGSISINPMDFR